MIWQIEIASREGIADPVGEGALTDAKDLAIKGIRSIRFVSIYAVQGDLSHEEVNSIAAGLLSDPVVNFFTVNQPIGDELGKQAHVVTVIRKPGVMDPVEESTLQGIRDMRLAADSVRTARKYIVLGEVSRDELELLARKSLANDVIEDVVFGHFSFREFHLGAPYRFGRREVDVLDADGERLESLSKEWGLSLKLVEMQTIREYFKKLGRNPTDCELETIAQTWSEHCKHKTFTHLIEYDGRVIDSLLKNTVMKVTRELDLPWCLSVFKDNAGVIDFDEKHGVCFKVETHNHPSAIEPYGGAGTGIGGVIRDILGTGLGGKPILNTDVFCFAPPDYPFERLPRGVLHPKRLLKGVVAGVRDYGNRMGIPTANGALFFDERYLGNCLVYCGTVGVIPKEKAFKEPRKGDLILLIGGRTGRDGIHGATFSSRELTEESEVVSSGAVQIGNPIHEKKVLDTLLAARDEGLYSAVTDCGGGGLSSAVGEMGAELGVEIDLEKVPLKYEGLSYTEIWISEAQERMILAVPPEKIERALELFESEDVEATVIGRFTGDGRLHLRYHGNSIADVEMEFLHHGLPKWKRTASWTAKRFPEPELPAKSDYSDDLKKVLSSWNVASKEWVVRQYDHEVQGLAAVKPFVGPERDGPSDACVITPVYGSRKGIAISNGMNPCYGDIDAYHMAAGAIDEALRNVVAVGGDPRRTALLDNFSWGNPDDPEVLGALVRAATACYDVAKAYRTPFISGKDSLNNEYFAEGKRIVIPHTLLISAISIVEDVTRCVTMDLKEAGNLIYIVGLTRPELGGSHYYRVHGHVGNAVPVVDAELGRTVMSGVHAAIGAGLVRSCHDCCEGGLAVALAEMAFAGGIGVEVSLADVPTAPCEVFAYLRKHANTASLRDDEILFSESHSRLILEVAPSAREAFERALAGVPCALIGRTVQEGILEIGGLSGAPVIKEELPALKEAWQSPLRILH